MTVMLGVPDKGYPGGYMTFIADASMTNKVEFVSEANNLCMTGKLILTDTDGRLGNFYDASPCLVGISITEKKSMGSSKSDGKFSSSAPGSGGNVFEHTFICDKILILGRQQNAVIYEFQFKSAMWTRMISTPKYSNMDAEEDTKIFDIIKEVLGTAFQNFKLLGDKSVSIDGESFDKIYSADPPILKNYITYSNDSVFDVLRFLQSRLYFCGDVNLTMATGLSYLNFDWLTGKIEVVDFDGVDVPPKYIDGTMVALDGKTFEQLISGKEQGFTSVSKSGFLPFVMNFFGYDVYNFRTEGIGPITYYKTEQISEFFNQKSLNFGEKIKFDANELKQFLFGDNGMFPETINYFRQYSSSHFNDGTFQKLLESLLTRDVLVFETTGNLTHMPGLIYTIAGKNKKEGGKGFDSEVNKNILGIFHVVKAVHTIVPVSKGDGERYREKLFLVKTWSK